MKCPNCHTKNRDDSKFCSNCAAPLGQVGGVGLDGATVTKTLEAPAVMLKPDALVVGKHKIVEESSRGGACPPGQWN